MAQTKKNTSRVSRTTTQDVSQKTLEGYGIENNSITTPGSAAGSSQYSDKPIKGGVVEIIHNEIIVRSPVLTKQDIENWQNANLSAVSRYYPNRTQLYDIYTNILRDPHLSGIIKKKVDAVLETDLYLHGPDGSKLDHMDDVINSLAFHEVLETLAVHDLWGTTGLEFIPGTELEVRQIPRKHIKTKTQLISIEQNVQDVGFDYTQLDNVWVIGKPEDLGILNVCAPMVLYKRGAMADWANFIEIFGQPMRVAKYDPHDETTVAALKQTIESTGSMLALLIPNTAEFEIIDGKTGNANGDLQAKFVAALDQQLSIAILGNTETTSNSGTGSQAKSKTHQKEQNKITAADLSRIEKTLNQEHFLNILRSYGHDIPKGSRFKFKKEVDVAYLAQRAQVDATLVNMGLPIEQEYFYSTYDIPRPGGLQTKRIDLLVTPAALAQHEEQETEADEQEEENKPLSSRARQKKKPAPKAPTAASEPPVTRAEIQAMLTDFFGPAL